MKRIIVYTHHLTYGGAERRASVYANYLFSKGYEVCVVTSHPEENEYPIDSKMQRYYVSNTKEEYLKLKPKKRLEELRRIFLNFKPETIISFLPKYCFYSLLATRFYKPLKRVNVIYSVALYQRKYGLKERLLDIFDCIFSRKIFLQCNEQLRCNRLWKRKCSVCYNPIVDKWGSLEQRKYDDISIISVGRLSKQKNFSLAIELVSKLQKQFPNVRLEIFGDGPQKEMLENKIVSLGAGDFIKIHSFKTSIELEYKKHNVMLCTSNFEGFPNVLAEGMMSGLICFSTPCPSGPKEMIDDGINGFLFKNYLDFSSKIISLFKSQEQCRKVSERTRLDAKARFEQETVLKSLLEKL